MRYTKICFLIAFVALVSSCKKEEIKVSGPQSFVINESKDKGQMRVDLSWSINGIPDDGTSSELMLYISPSEENNFTKLDESFSAAYKSLYNYNGKELVYPSGWNLEKLIHRYYLGVVYNGNYSSSTGPLV